MFNEKEQILDIIEGFKTLASKIQKDNNNIKETVKDKDIALVACEKEYKKLYYQHEN